MSEQFSLQEAAKLVGKSESTLLRWKREGVDITNPDDLVRYNQIKNVRSIGANRTRVRQANADIMANIGELPEPGAPGAAAALKRLEAFETKFAARLDRALESDNAELIQIARDDHAKTADQLRRYEREIEVSKRDLGHLISKGEAAIGVRMAAVWMRLTWKAFLSSSLPDVVAAGSHDLREAKVKAEEMFDEILLVQLQNAKGAQATLPEWAISLIKEEFRIE
jgi:hypothetical protein